MLADQLTLFKPGEGEIMLHTALLAPFPRIQKATSSSVTTPEFDILDGYQMVSFEGGYPEF